MLKSSFDDEEKNSDSAVWQAELATNIIRALGKACGRRLSVLPRFKIIPPAALRVYLSHDSACQSAFD